MSDTRLRLKCSISTLVSDLGLLTKVPMGRVDTLVDRHDEAPEEFRAMVAGQVPAKGSSGWRTATAWVMELRVPVRKQRAIPGASKVRRHVYGRVSFNEFGEVSFRRALVKDLRQAGQQHSSDTGEDVDLSVALDIAESMLALEGVPSGTPHFSAALAAAAELVAG